MSASGNDEGPDTERQPDGVHERPTWTGDEPLTADELEMVKRENGPAWGGIVGRYAAVMARKAA